MMRGMTLAPQVTKPCGGGARCERAPDCTFSAHYPGLPLDDADRISDSLCELRTARGERVIGRKIGFTNRTIWAEYAVYPPMWGFVLDTTVHDLPCRARQQSTRLGWRRSRSRASSPRSYSALPPGDHHTDRTRESAGLHKLDAFAIVRRLSAGRSHMRWFRSHRTHVGWLACIVLTCHLVLSFGHIHVGKAVANFGIASFLVSQGVTGNPPGIPPHKNRSDLADEDCAICVSIRLASTLIGPSLPTVEAPGFIFKSLTWPAPNAGSVRFAQLPVRARGPPYS
jgi:hypothetical protein